MGCSASAIADDERELEWALKKTGIDRRIDGLGFISLYSAEADSVIESARAGLNAEQTLSALRVAIEQREQRIRDRVEREERTHLHTLLTKYGVPEEFK